MTKIYPPHQIYPNIQHGQQTGIINFPETGDINLTTTTTGKRTIWSCDLSDISTMVLDVDIVIKFVGNNGDIAICRKIFAVKNVSGVTSFVDDVYSIVTYQNELEIIIEFSGTIVLVSVSRIGYYHATVRLT